MTDGKSSNSYPKNAVTAFFDFARYKRGAAYMKAVQWSVVSVWCCGNTTQGQIV